MPIKPISIYSMDERTKQKITKITPNYSNLMIQTIEALRNEELPIARIRSEIIEFLKQKGLYKEKQGTYIEMTYSSALSKIAESNLFDTNEVPIKTINYEEIEDTFFTSMLGKSIRIPYFALLIGIRSLTTFFYTVPEALIRRVMYEIKINGEYLIKNLHEKTGSALLTNFFYPKNEKKYKWVDFDTLINETNRRGHSGKRLEDDNNYLSDVLKNMENLDFIVRKGNKYTLSKTARTVHEGLSGGDLEKIKNLGIKQLLKPR